MNSYRLMVRRLRSVLSLSWRDRWDLAQAWILLVLLDLGLRLAPFRQVQRLALSSKRVRRELAEGDAAVTIGRLQRLVDAAAHHHLYPMTCLRRSLVLQRLLARRGIPVDLQIGVQHEAGHLKAHAWVEYRGRAIGEPQAISTQFPPLTAPEAD